MIKEILRMGGCKTQKEFLKKYPTEESFLEAFPQARPLLEGYKNGGSLEAFPQARPLPEYQATRSQTGSYLNLNLNNNVAASDNTNTNAVRNVKMQQDAVKIEAQKQEQQKQQKLQEYQQRKREQLQGNKTYVGQAGTPSSKTAVVPDKNATPSLTQDQIAGNRSIMFYDKETPAQTQQRVAAQSKPALKATTVDNSNVITDPKEIERLNQMDEYRMLEEEEHRKAQLEAANAMGRQVLDDVLATGNMIGMTPFPNPVTPVIGAISAAGSTALAGYDAVQALKDQEYGTAGVKTVKTLDPALKTLSQSKNPWLAGVGIAGQAFNKGYGLMTASENTAEGDPSLKDALTLSKSAATAPQPGFEKGALPPIMSRKTGGYIPAFPQQPTESQFFDYSYPTANVPRLFKSGGMAFPQAPTEQRFFDYSKPTPNVPRLFQQGGQQQGNPLVMLMQQITQQYNMDPNTMAVALQKLPEEMLQDLTIMAETDPESAAQSLMELYQTESNQPIVQMGGVPNKFANGGSTTDNPEAEKEYYKFKEFVETARQAIGTNDKKTLNSLRLDGKPYSKNDLAKDFQTLQDLRKKAGLGAMEEAKILFPHVGQQLRGSINNLLGTTFKQGGMTPTPTGGGMMEYREGPYGTASEEYGGSVFNYGQRPAIMEKGGSIGMNKENTFLSDKLQKFVGKLEQNATQGLLKEAEEKMGEYYGYRKGGQKKGLKRFQGAYSMPDAGFMDYGQSMQDVMNDAAMVEAEMKMKEQMGQTMQPGQLTDYEMNKMADLSANRPQGISISEPNDGEIGPPKPDYILDRELVDDQMASMPGSTAAYHYTDQGDYTLGMKQRKKEKAARRMAEKSCPEGYEYDRRIQQCVPAGTKSKSAVGKGLAKIKENWNKKSGVEKAETIVNTLSAIARPFERRKENLKEEQLEEFMFNPANVFKPYTSNKGKWDVNTGAFDPYNTTYGNSNMAAYGGQLPLAQSGLDVKMRGGLGFNANQLSWPVMAGEFSKPDLNVGGSLGPIDRDDATLEAEKDETAYTDLAGIGIPQLYNIEGKKHSEGGTPLDLPDNSFIFSEFMKLKDKEQLAMFGINKKKRGGVSFADISKKFKINDHLKSLMSEESDELTRDTAQANIVNSNMKLGKLALLQESMKGFPDGIPLVSMPYLQSVGISPEQLAMMMPTGSIDRSAEDMGMEEARYGANVVAKMRMKKMGGLPKAQEGKSYVIDKEYYYTPSNKDFGLNSEELAGTPYLGEAANVKKFVDETESGRVFKGKTLKWVDKSGKPVKDKTVWGFSDPSTGAFRNYDVNQDGTLSKEERQRLKEEYDTVSKEYANKLRNINVPGSYRTGIGQVGSWFTGQPWGISTQDVVDDLGDVVANSQSRNEESWSLLNFVETESTEMNNAVALRDKYIADMKRISKAIEGKSIFETSAESAKIGMLTSAIAELDSFIDDKKLTIEQGDGYIYARDPITGKPKALNLTSDTGVNTRFSPSTSLMMDYDAKTKKPVFRKEEGQVTIPGYSLKSVQQIESQKYLYEPPAPGSVESIPKTPAATKTTDKLTKDYDKENWVITNTGKYQLTQKGRETFMPVIGSVINDVNSGKIDLIDVPHIWRPYVKKEVSTTLGGDAVLSPAPAPAVSDSSGTATKDNKTATPEKKKTSTNSGGTRRSSGTAPKTSIDYGDEGTDYAKQQRERAKNLENMERVFKRRGGPLDRFIPKYQWAGPYSQYPTQSRTKKDGEYVVILPTKDFQKFGTQSFNVDKGYYTVTNPETGEVAELPIDDFVTRQSGILENYKNAKGKTGVDAWKEDALSKNDKTRLDAIDFFQNSYNDFRIKIGEDPYFFGDKGPYTVDKKFGIYTWSAPGYAKGKTPPGETPKARYKCDENGKIVTVTDGSGYETANEAAMYCPNKGKIPPEIVPGPELDPKETPVGGDFWTEDVINTSAAFRNLGDIQKYLPWQAAAPFYAAQPTFESPERAIGAVGEALTTGIQGATAFGDAQGYGAVASSMMGNAAANTANIIADVNNRNIQTANQFEMANKQAYNTYLQNQADRATNLYDKTVIANQQFDNARREARDEMRQQFVNAWTNRGKTQTLNAMYSDQYYTDPKTGYTYLTNPRDFEYTEPTYDNMPDYLKKIYDQAMAKGEVKTALEAYNTWKEIVGKKSKEGSRDAYAQARNIRGVTDDES